jgi:hypothetical protein
MQLYSIPGDRTLGLTTRGVSTRDRKERTKGKTYASERRMQLRVQKESRRDYIRSTIGQARAHGPCLYMFDRWVALATGAGPPAGPASRF